ncbi:MAG: DUF3299 domain-containing protein [Oceanicaulis sp.]
MRKILLSLAAFGLLAGHPFAAAPEAAAQTPNATPAYLDLGWADLLPEGEAERIAQLQQMQAVQSGFDHFGADAMPQIQTFNVVDDLDGERVRIPGYILPFDFSGSGEVTRFLLVPYVGACIHVPPPPPNQLVYVTTETPITVERMWDPVFAEGVMRTERQDNELGDAAYTLELIAVTPYDS